VPNLLIEGLSSSGYVLQGFGTEYFYITPVSPYAPLEDTVIIQGLQGGLLTQGFGSYPPMINVPTTAPVALTLTGTGTNWTADTVWIITQAGVSLSSSQISVLSPTLAIWSVGVSSNSIGTLSISDGVTSALVTTHPVLVPHVTESVLGQVGAAGTSSFTFNVPPIPPPTLYPLGGRAYTTAEEPVLVGSARWFQP
jgi:hypothetical protein